MMVRRSIHFPFQRGYVHAPDELGDITVGNILVRPYAQPQAHFEISRGGQTIQFTTNGAQLVRENLGERTEPILIRAGLGLMAALMISPPEHRLTLHDVEDMAVVQHATGMLWRLAGPRFGLTADSAMVFAQKYSNQLKFVDIDLLSQDEF